jgi:hypothetical protein
VGVIELRDERGRKRSRADVLAEKPLFGYLILSPGSCYLQAREDAPPTVGAMLPALINARVKHIRKGSIVIIGGYLVPGDGPLTKPIPQSWWVRPTGHGGINAP